MTVCNVSTVPVYKKKKRMVILGKVTILSTFKEVLQSSRESTGVLHRQYYSTSSGVLEALTSVCFWGGKIRIDNSLVELN
jgi:hypothetical protein